MRYWTLEKNAFVDGNSDTDSIRNYHMDDDELFEAMELTRASLAPVARAVKYADYDRAMEAYLTYFNVHKPQVWLFDRSNYRRFMEQHYPKCVELSIIEADLLVQRTICFFPWVPQNKTPEGEYDWFHTDRVIEGKWVYSEYIWSLYQLGRAFMLTGDTKYAEHFQSLFNGWYESIGSTPVQYDLESEMLIAGQRNMRIIDGLFALQNSGYLTTRTLRNALKAILASNRVLYRLNAYHTGNSGWKNGQYAAVCTLIAASAVFPEFKESRDWLERGKQRWREHLFLDTYADGGQLEPSSNYHEPRLRDGFYAWFALKFNSIEHDYLREIAQPFEKLSEFSFYTATPTGHCFSLCDGNHVESHLIFLPIAASGFRRGDLEWLRRKFFTRDFVPTQGKLIPFIMQLVTDRTYATSEVNPEAPVWKSHFFEDTGLAIMRESWERDALYASVYCGRSVLSHAHRGTGFLELWCHGRPLIGSRGYGYRTPEEHAVMYLPDVQIPIVFDIRRRFWHTGEATDIISFDHDAYGSSHRASVERTVVYQKDPGYIATMDVITGPIHGKPVRWGGITMLDVERVHGGFVCRDSQAPDIGLLIVPMPSRKIEYLVEATTKEPLYDHVQFAGDLPDLLKTNTTGAQPYEAPASRIAFETEAGNRGTSFFVILMPFKGRQPDCTVRRLVARATLAVYEVHHENGTDTFMFRPGSRDKGKVAFGSFAIDAHMAVISQQDGLMVVTLIRPAFFAIDGHPFLRGFRIRDAELRITDHLVHLSCHVDQYADVLIPGCFGRLWVDGTEQPEYLNQDGVVIHFYKPSAHTIEAIKC